MGIDKVLPSTADRVSEATGHSVNRAIREEMEERVARTVWKGPAAIDRRLAELDHEWDIERTLEANAATISLVGLGLGIMSDRRFLALPTVVAGFLLQHALQGWCPPLPLFRRMGVRTASEIEEERFILKALRGDFKAVQGSDDSLFNIDNAINAARS